MGNKTLWSFPIFNDKELDKEEEPPGGLLKMGKKITVSSFLHDKGLGINLNHLSFKLNYPEEIWQTYPLAARRILAQNLAFLSTFSLPYLFPQLEKLIYRMPMPLSEPFIFKGLSLSLPSIALLQEKKEDRSTVSFLKRLFNIKYKFLSKKTILPKVRHGSDKKGVIIPFSFGKDSLLTLALCDELGLKTYPVYIGEPSYQYEWSLKEELARDFQKEFDISVSFLDNQFGFFRQGDGYVGWELQLTQYSLLVLPYIYAYNAGFIFFANEQSCNDIIIDQDGFSCNPVYEQSHSWLLSNSVLASLVGGNSLTIGSIIEPLYEIAIIKILHERYPEFAKYQSSCDPEDKDKEELSGRRWCENCSKCARIFIFLLAHGVDPQIIGFENWLLGEKHKSLYAIFDLSSEKSYSYDQSGAGKDEQLLAFYLASKKGTKGILIDEFVKNYQEEVEKKEDSLRKKYFGIHSTTTVPSLYRKNLLHIFREELDSLV